MSTNDNPLITSRRTEKVILWPGNIQATIDDLQHRIGVAEVEAQSDVRKLKVAEKLATELDGIKDHPEKVPGTTIVEVGSISERDEQKLLNEHPPRQSDKGDELVGYNAETFPKALIFKCLISPEVTATQFNEAWDAWSSSVKDEIRQAVRTVNHGGVNLPKFSAVSLLQQTRAAASKRRRDTE